MRKYFLILLACAIAIPGISQKSKISLKLKKGKEYRHISDSKINVKQEIFGQKMDVNMGVYGEMSYMVEDIQDTIYHLKTEYNRLRMDMEMPQMSMSYDSDKEDSDDMVSNIMHEMIHKPFILYMSQKGTISSIKNINVLFDDAFNLTELSGDQLEMMKEQLDQYYGEDAFKGNFEMVTAVFPDRPVAIGDTWEVKTSIKSTVVADVVTTFKFVEKGKDYYTIEGSSVISTGEDIDFVELNGMQVKYLLNGTTASTIKINKKTGWVINATMTQEMGGNIIFKGLMSPDQETSVPMTMINETIIKGE